MIPEFKKLTDNEIIEMYYDGEFEEFYEDLRDIEAFDLDAWWPADENDMNSKDIEICIKLFKEHYPEIEVVCEEDLWESPERVYFNITTADEQRMVYSLVHYIGELPTMQIS